MHAGPCEMNHRLAQAMKPWAALQFSDWLLIAATWLSLEPPGLPFKNWRRWVTATNQGAVGGACVGTRDGGAPWWGT